MFVLPAGGNTIPTVQKDPDILRKLIVSAADTIFKQGKTYTKIIYVCALLKALKWNIWLR